MTINYEGAGLLVMTRDMHGSLHALMGRRRFAPGKGTWSFPGGGRQGRRRHLALGLSIRDYTDETLAETALRETAEELRLWTGAPLLPSPEEIREIWSIAVLGFRWTTFLWATENPGLALPSNGEHPEFLEFGWFDMSRLPSPLHFGVAEAIGRARSSMR